MDRPSRRLRPPVPREDDSMSSSSSSSDVRGGPELSLFQSQDESKSRYFATSTTLTLAPPTSTTVVRRQRWHRFSATTTGVATTTTAALAAAAAAASHRTTTPATASSTVPCAAALFLRPTAPTSRMVLPIVSRPTMLHLRPATRSIWRATAAVTPTTHSSGNAAPFLLEHGATEPKNCDGDAFPIHVTSEPSQVPSGTKRQRSSSGLSSSKKHSKKSVRAKPSQNANGPLRSGDRSPPLPTTIRRTHSFDAVWAGTLDPHTRIRPHTLLLGTHPSITSLERGQYYGHPLNAFWWIAGDCLGFRRDAGFRQDGTTPLQLTQHLRYGPDAMLPYHKQVQCLVSHGFALWDVVRSCHREGSLDGNIRNELPNDIVGFCQSFPSIRRVVLVNGGSGAKLLVRHLGSSPWLTEQDWTHADHPASEKAFGALLKRHQGREGPLFTATSDVLKGIERLGAKASSPLVLVAALSVSPAAAKYSYVEKRDFWEQHVYRPGLDLLRTSMAQLQPSDASTTVDGFTSPSETDSLNRTTLLSPRP